MRRITGVLLPVIITGLSFLLIPAMYLGFDSSGDPTVMSMTSAADTIEQSLRQTEAIKKDEAEKLAARLAAGYDDAVITMSLDTCNHYWFVAIFSVLHAQDVHEMDERSLRDTLISSLSWTLRTEAYTVTEGEGEDAVEVEKTRVYIDIAQMDHEQLMDALGFEQERRDWAFLLYWAMADDQNIPFDSGDYRESYGVDYGDLRFTDGATEVVYFSQADKRWGAQPYGKSGTIASSGCGPTSLAMVVSSLTGRYIDPSEMAAWAYQNGYRCEGSGSYHSLIPEGARHFGLSVEGASWNDGQKLIDALASGRLVIAIMSQGHFNRQGGHFIVLRGVTSEGGILVADSISVKRSNQEWDLRIILGEANRKAGSAGPFWIVSNEA